MLVIVVGSQPVTTTSLLCSALVLPRPSFLSYQNQILPSPGDANKQPIKYKILKSVLTQPVFSFELKIVGTCN